MNDFVLELLQRKKCKKTIKALGDDLGRRGILQKLDKFVLYKKEKNDENKNGPINKLSFEVSYFFKYFKLKRL